MHADRYERADEFVDVATKLWDSWEDDALVADKDAGVFADADLIHAIDHVGQHFRGRRAAQRAPLAAGPPGAGAGRLVGGRQGFAARCAEAVFTAQQTLADAQAFYARPQGAGRAASAATPTAQDPARASSRSSARTEAEAERAARASWTR